MSYPKTLPMIRKGDRIYFKPEWQDKGDDKVEFRAQADQYGDSVEVVAMLGLPFNPWHVAKVNMIERVEPCQVTLPPLTGKDGAR